MIRRPPRSTLDRSSAASDVYKRQTQILAGLADRELETTALTLDAMKRNILGYLESGAVSYTHLRAHETVLDLVCRLLLEKKTTTISAN